MQNTMEIRQDGEGGARLVLRLSRSLIRALIAGDGEASVPVTDYFHGRELPSDATTAVERCGPPMGRMTLVTRFDTLVPASDPFETGVERLGLLLDPKVTGYLQGLGKGVGT